MALNTKYKAFCEEYLANGYNATKAYYFAFDCSIENANRNAFLMLKKPEVKAYLDEREKEIFEGQRINAEHIASELSRIAFEIDGTKATNSEKMKALELLQKQMGLQQTNIKADVDNKVVIDINIKEEE